MSEEAAPRSELEILGFPEEDGWYKLIQLEVDRVPVSVLGKGSRLKRHVAHWQILEEFLEKRGIEYESETLPYGAKAPKLSGERYEVVGMGEIGIFPESKSAIGPERGCADYMISLDKEQSDTLVSRMKKMGYELRESLW